MRLFLFSIAALAVACASTVPDPAPANTGGSGGTAGSGGSAEGGGANACGPGGTIVAEQCVCEPGFTGADCRDCQPGYEAMGEDCVALPTDWMPYTVDENVQSGRITGFPAVLAYGGSGPHDAQIGSDGLNDAPVGSCEVVDDALLGVAPALRCEWEATYEESADPMLGGDPHGYGQTYLGPGGLEIDPALGDVTAISIAFVWQFGAGWLDAMKARDDRRFETPWSAPYADIEIGGAGAKPLITHREDCEYWYDVTADLGSAAAGTMTGMLTAPNGILVDSVEIVAGATFLRSEGGTLYQGSSAVGSIASNGSYDFTLTGVAPGTPLTAFYRTEAPGGDPEQARFQQNGAWRQPLASNSCRERPMMLGSTIASAGGPDIVEPALSLTMGDDIACYCWDYDGTTCNERSDQDRRVQFRIGDPSNDIPAEGVYHVGVAEPVYVEMIIDTVNDMLDLRITTPDGRFDDTLVSHSSFCDSPDNGAVRYNANPHRWGHIVRLGEPFWALPLSPIPANAWHQVGQWRINGATDGTPLPRQGPPLGFVRE